MFAEIKKKGNEIKEKDNIIGSLRGDIKKLDYIRLVLESNP